MPLRFARSCIYGDTSTPLVVRRGNPNLKAEKKHNVSAFYRYWLWPREVQSTWNASYTLWQDALVQGMAYDAATGVRTYTPNVVGGNWQASVKHDFDMPLDKKKERWKMEWTTSLVHRHAVDLLSLGTEAASHRTSVRRTTLGEGISFSWQDKKSIYVKAFAKADYVYAAWGKDCDNISAVDFSYGLYGRYSHKCGLEASTDLAMYSRRGYTDDTFNTKQFIWNIRLSQSLGKGRVLMAIEGFDLLDKQSAYVYYVDAQMQRETYTNVLRRYVMLSLTYRLNREKRKESRVK